MSSRCVLVAEDQLVLRDLFKEFLESYGYRVEVAATAIEVLDILRTERVEAVVLDIKMPGEFGGDAVVAAVSAKAPVIVVSGEGDEDFERKLLAEGAFAFLRKPINLTLLAERVREALDHHQRRRAHD